MPASAVSRRGSVAPVCGAGRLLVVALFALLGNPGVAQSGAYGSKTVRFAVQFSGDPYDPDQNDVHVLFVDRNGNAYDRIAYFDGYAWSANFSAPEAGRYVAKLRRNGAPTYEPDRPLQISQSDRLPHGSPSLDPRSPFALREATGERWVGLGLDLSQARLMPLETLVALVSLGRAGGTWARLGAFESLDAPSHTSAPFDLRRLRRWDDRIRLAEVLGVRLNVCLFSAKGVLPGSEGWDRHPWRQANGGFLKTPEEFFRADEAKKKAKAWIRHAVARWGGSPALLSWELMDDARGLVRNEALGEAFRDWSKEMRAYLVELSPNALVTAATPGHEADSIPRLEETDGGREWPKADRAPVFAVFRGDAASGPAHAAARSALWSALASGASALGVACLDWNMLTEQIAQLIRPLAVALSFSGLAYQRLPSQLIVSASGGYEVEGIGEAGAALVRVVRMASGEPAPCTLSGLPLSDGSYELIQIDLTTGRFVVERVAIKNFRLDAPFEPISADVAVSLRPQIR